MNEGDLPPEVFEKLLKKYRESLPESIQIIEQTINALRAEINKQNLESFRFQVHKMAGSAAIFGYEKVTAVSREWEIRIAGLLAKWPAVKVDSAILGELDLFLTFIRKELAING